MSKLESGVDVDADVDDEEGARSSSAWSAIMTAEMS